MATNRPHDAKRKRPQLQPIITGIRCPEKVDSPMYMIIIQHHHEPEITMDADYISAEARWREDPIFFGFVFCFLC